MTYDKSYFDNNHGQPLAKKSITSLNLLAPAVYINHQKAPLLRTIAKFLPAFRFLFGNKEFGHVPPIVQNILNSFCTEGDILCSQLFSLLCGPDNGHTDPGRTVTQFRSVSV